MKYFSAIEKSGYSGNQAPLNRGFTRRFGYIWAGGLAKLTTWNDR